jgi:hypothetical protein
MIDLIVVGSGPAGVSAAWPWVLAGKQVVMLDVGVDGDVSVPAGSYIDVRRNTIEQQAWMVGRTFHSLRAGANASPKLRTPTLAYVFDGFNDANKIYGQNFTALGSLAAGGLSNAWGCGVAAWDEHELAAFPFDAKAMHHSYAEVAKRIGISGAAQDDLAGYFGVDDWSDLPVPMDRMHKYIVQRYQANSKGLRAGDFRMGRSRVAVLTRERAGRSTCDLSGTCLWGCHRRALYTAKFDLEALRRHANFRYVPNFKADRFAEQQGAVTVLGTAMDTGEPRQFSGSRLMMAAGTLATTRIAMESLDLSCLPLQSSPMAAFLLWLPSFLGSPREASFGLGQLSFVLALPSGGEAFGSTFSTAGLPVSEFVRHLPFRRRFGIDVLKSLLSSCVVGNVFFPGRFSRHEATFDACRGLVVHGVHAGELGDEVAAAHKKLALAYRRLGAWMLPGSFTVGSPGADLHYACSMPMVETPDRRQTDSLGRPGGVGRVHIVDGTVLSVLQAKSHTLTIMANADRIAKEVLLHVD